MINYYDVNNNFLGNFLLNYLLYIYYNKMIYSKNILVNLHQE